MNPQKGNILIVDDEKGLRLGTQRLLEEEGYVVSAAENGTEGLRYGTQNEYDVAVIDLKMPDIDGLDVLKEIKRVHPNTVCFIATAFASYDTAVQSTRLGAFGYIQKPFSTEEFIYQIEQGIKQRNLILAAERLAIEREQNLLELASEKSRLNAIIKSISEGVLVININGEVGYYNYAALKLLNITNINIGENILGNLPSQIVELVEKIYSSDKILLKSFTTEFVSNKGDELYIEAACTPIPQPDGSLAGVVIILSNITEYRRIEIIKNQFVSMVAHELKTPLAAVQGFLNIILDKSITLTEEKEEDYIKRSTYRLKSLTDLVNDLLDISRMELKTKQREIVNVHIENVIASTLQMLELEISKKHLTINKNIQKDLPVIKADINEITRIVTNLLSNAIKYNREKGEIIIEVTCTSNFLSLKIQDTGVGMKPDEKVKLFTEFYRAKNEKTRGINGTGLGLSIVKRIVDSYYGRIDVESEFGVGSTFLINLPINHN
ncbi:MAG: response regulator [Melioribacteraceae bacterium]|nr:response regulator [Melioribacteraceae bacterium]